MAEQQSGVHASVALDAKNLAARVVIPRSVDPQTVSMQLLTSLARERGVEMSLAAEQRLSEIVQRAKLSAEPIDEVFLQATLPIHGEAAYIEWAPGFNPAAPDEREHDRSKADDGKVDYYAHQSFVRVTREDHVATIHEPTPGTDGRDVTGRTIPANPGKPLALTIDPSLLKLPDGRVLGQLDGLLSFDGKKLKVDPILEIQGTVDFSTGNIDFDGDVVIRRDIRDKFRVRASQNVTIEGLIDASHIDCGGNLSARRGVAGRGEGTLAVRGDAHIGYLDAVTGNIEGSLHFAKEMMHCTLSIGGNLVSDVGRVIGGRVTVAGDVRVAELGSESETPTVLRLTAVPDDNSPAGKAAAEIAGLHKQVAGWQKELTSLEATAGGTTPTIAERITELSFEIGDARGRITTLSARYPKLAATATNTGCDATLDILKQIHGRVDLTIGTHMVHFGEAVKGPVRIWLEGAREVMCKFGDGTPKPIRTLTGVTDRAAAA
jgi:uncharacterized protein (DUF342 family)